MAPTGLGLSARVGTPCLLCVCVFACVCLARAVGHWKSLWCARTVRRRLRRDACQVMQLTSRPDADATALVQSLL